MPIRPVLCPGLSKGACLLRREFVAPALMYVLYTSLGAPAHATESCALLKLHSLALAVAAAGNAEATIVYKAAFRRQADPLAQAGEKKEKCFHIEQWTAAFGADMAGADGAFAGHCLSLFNSAGQRPRQPPPKSPKIPVS